ncbi:MAG: hypothetical protein ACQJCO_07440 [cyanobacterium endosymbiont of Rhopalodia sterrenbergii]
MVTELATVCTRNSSLRVADILLFSANGRIETTKYDIEIADLYH